METINPQGDAEAISNPVDIPNVPRETQDTVPNPQSGIDEVPTRMTSKDFYYKRQMDTLQKQHDREMQIAREKLHVTDEGKEDPEVLREAYQETQKQLRESEIDRFLDKNPNFEPYKEKIKKYSLHPAYNDLPVEELVYASAGRDLINLGQQQQEKTNSSNLADANQSISGGASNFDRTREKGINDMTDAEFTLHLENVKRGII